MSKSEHTIKSKGLTIAVITLLTLFLLSGIGIMFYPIVAANYAEAHRSEIQTTYEDILKEVDTTEMESLYAAAVKYNEALATGVFSPLEYEENGYFEQLLLPHTEIMCFISIPKINVYLPVYHGVGDDVLDRGAGHMEQSSLPVGGESTHAVISAHTGMAQNPMFSDLELLETGDIFQITILGKTLTYEVNDTQVVLPQMVDVIQIQTGQDIVSLITCTPYGVNSHRLIVQGSRIETPAEEEIQQIVQQATLDKDNQSVWKQQYWNSVKIGISIAVLLLALVLITCITCFLSKKLKKKGGANEA